MNPAVYLASLAYLRALLRAELGLEPPPAPPARPNRSVIRGAWGEQTLTVPLAGGRQARLRDPASLQVSEHGNWRHTHWQALTSAYGALPYFHYLEAPFSGVYASGEQNFATLCADLHRVTLEAAGLPELIAWLRENPRRLRLPADASLFPPHVAAVELIFSRGPESVFYLLGD